MLPEELLPSSGCLVTSTAEPHLTVANPDFNLERLLRASIAREPQQDEDLAAESLFGGPWLTAAPSAELTPPSNPQINAAGPALTAQALHLFSLSPLSSPESSAAEEDDELDADSLQLSLPLPPDVPTERDRKSRRKASSRAGRRKRREKARAASYGYYRVRSRVEERYQQGAEPIRCSLDLKDSDVTSTAFTGKDDGSRPRKEWTVEELTGPNSKLNFQYAAWDGRTPTPVVDSKKRIVTILAGQPDDKNWDVLHRAAATALEQRRHRCRIPRKARRHRRGAFTTLSTGLSHGNGQTEPSNVRHEGQNRAVVDELDSMDAFKRIAGHASAVMANWAPDLYQYYSEKLGQVHRAHPHLKRPFPSSIFSAAAYNFGPKTVCYRHVDFANLPFGWCSVTALGSYNPKRGGHLILWDCHLVVEFPPGSTILLPSAIVAHSNTPIAPHERRYSFALYSAGALFRWAENGCRTAAAHLASLTAEELAAVEARNAARWDLGLSLMPVFGSKKAACPST